MNSRSHLLIQHSCNISEHFTKVYTYVSLNDCGLYYGYLPSKVPTFFANKKYSAFQLTPTKGRQSQMMMPMRLVTLTNMTLKNEAKKTILCRTPSISFMRQTSFIAKNLCYIIVLTLRLSLLVLHFQMTFETKSLTNHSLQYIEIDGERSGLWNRVYDDQMTFYQSIFCGNSQ